MQTQNQRYIHIWASQLRTHRERDPWGWGPYFLSSKICYCQITHIIAQLAWNGQRRFEFKAEWQFLGPGPCRPGTVVTPLNPSKPWLAGTGQSTSSQAGFIPFACGWTAECYNTPLEIKLSSVLWLPYTCFLPKEYSQGQSIGKHPSDQNHRSAPIHVEWKLESNISVAFFLWMWKDTLGQHQQDINLLLHLLNLDCHVGLKFFHTPQPCRSIHRAYTIITRN